MCVNGIHPFSPLNSQPPIEVNESPAIHSHLVYISEGLLFAGGLWEAKAMSPMFFPFKGVNDLRRLGYNVFFNNFVVLGR